MDSPQLPPRVLALSTRERVPGSCPFASPSPLQMRGALKQQQRQQQQWGEKLGCGVVMAAAAAAAVVVMVVVALQLVVEANLEH